MPKSKRGSIFSLLTRKKTKIKTDKKSADIKTRKLIYKTLKNHYMHYNENVWKKILTEKNWEKYFNDNWLDKNKKRDHGGYINPTEMKEIMADNSILPKELPSLENKNNIYKIIVPTCSFNLKEYQRKYITILRKLLHEFHGEILELDLSSNGGGKTEVIASGLLPLFLLQPSKKLTLIENAKGVQKECVKIVNNEIYNLPVNVNKTKSMENAPKKINIYIGNQTASAAEQITLALTLLKKISQVTFLGNPSAGFTTWIDYIELPNGGGFEYPVGTMVSISGVKARSNGRLYTQDLNL